MAILARSLNSVVATVTGTGSAVNVDIGFVPNYVRCLDVSSGDVEFVWSQGMNGASGGSAVTGFIASNSALTTGGRFATIAAAAGGITSLDGSAGSGIGFTIGTNTDINRAGHAYLCTGWR